MRDLAPSWRVISIIFVALGSIVLLFEVPMSNGQTGALTLYAAACATGVLSIREFDE